MTSPETCFVYEAVAPEVATVFDYKADILRPEWSLAFVIVASPLL